MRTEAEWDAAGLLEELGDGDRAGRIALLDRLDAAEYTIPELQDAAARGLLTVLLADRVLAGPNRYTGTEIAERADVDVDLMARIRQVGGLDTFEADERRYTDLELNAARTTREFVELGIPDDVTIRVARLMGRTLGPLAEGLRDALLDSVIEDGLTELEIAERLEALATGAVPLLRELLDYVSRSHFRSALASELSARVPHLPAGARPVVVAFADLVGFTRLGTTIPAEELVAVAERLDELAADVVAPPVRLTKSLGDGIMLVSTEAEPLVAATLALVAAADAEGERFPQVHVGVAAGEAFNRAGDWYGAPVNLASRISDAARAGSVLTTREVRDMAREGFRWSNAGARSFKGVPGSTALYRARPASAAGDPAAR
jgi:adenylate cyclase